jgi:glycosyltransferase involved in cell wall biosynthesis
MRITIAMGFFLPVPPLAGGATEKTWQGLAREFAARGHEVTVISRRWPGLPPVEVCQGVRHLRLRGHAHTSSLPYNLWLDLLWSRRVGCALPPADVTIVNCVALPVWLGWFRGGTGRLVVMPGRIPKGQFRLYRRLDRVLAVSSVVRDAVIAENPRLAPRLRVFGYPIDWTGLAGSPRTTTVGDPVTIGYVGRLHREKGLDLLVAAAAQLAARKDLPAWRLLLCGPSDVARGGSGAEFAADLDRQLGAALPPGRFRRLDPEFSEEGLAAIYRQIDVFCYPSLSVHGETFGVAVTEAMAAGAVPVVSSLKSFADFVHSGQNGIVFDQAASDAAARLANALAGLLGDSALRARLAASARASTRNYDFPWLAERLLEDFSTLLPSADRQT